MFSSSPIRFPQLDDSYAWERFLFSPGQRNREERDQFDFRFNLDDSIHGPPPMEPIEYYPDQALPIPESFAPRRGARKPRAPKMLSTKNFPTRRFRKGESECAQCSICLVNYKSNCVLRTLPCLHEYHRKCIDQWFTKTVACPLCRCDFR